MVCVFGPWLTYLCVCEFVTHMHLKHINVSQCIYEFVTHNICLYIYEFETHIYLKHINESWCVYLVRD